MDLIILKLGIQIVHCELNNKYKKENERDALHSVAWFGSTNRQSPSDIYS